MGPSRTRARVGWVLLPAALLGSPTAARAQRACPSAVEVERALTALASREGPGQTAFDEALGELEVNDLGSRYRVQFRSQTREYDDPTRDCAGRARVVAVFVALVLAPGWEPDAEAIQPNDPSMIKPQPGSVQRPDASVEDGDATHRNALPERKRERERDRWSVEGAATVAIAPQRKLVVLPGVAAAAAWMRNGWGGMVGGEASVIPGSLWVDPTTVHLTRFPTRLGVRHESIFRSFTGTLEVAGVVVIVSARRGDDGATWVEPGVRGGALVRAGRGRVAPYVNAACEWVPSPRSLALEPDGPVTHSPRLWISLAAGLSLGSARD